jgi:hypothetical protein
VKGSNRVLEIHISAEVDDKDQITVEWREDGLRMATFSKTGVGRSMLIMADRFPMSEKEWRTDGEALISGESEKWMASL